MKQLQDRQSLVALMFGEISRLLLLCFVSLRSLAVLCSNFRPQHIAHVKNKMPVFSHVCNIKN